MSMWQTDYTAGTLNAELAIIIILKEIIWHLKYVISSF